MSSTVERHNREEEEEDDDDEETLDETGYKTVKDAVLFAIDVSHSMLKKPPPSDSKKADLDSPTAAALKCAYQLMQQRIISHPNDMMGVLLFGTEQSRFQDESSGGRGSLQYPHCYLLTDLDVPAAGDVKRLRNLVEDEEEAEKLLLPSEEPVSMANVLFCANQIFTTKAPNFTSRRLFLVTDNDSPHADNKNLRQSAAVRAKDLYDLGVVIELFPIAHPDHGFDRAKFYDDIVYRPTLTDPEAPAPTTEVAQPADRGDGISLLQALISNINSKAAPRRALFSLPFEIGPGLKIGVKGYIVIKRQEKIRSCYVWMNGEKPQIAIPTSTKIAEDTAREVQKTEIRKAYKFGGETVSFTEDETKAIRYFSDPVIRIIGFKPLQMLPEWATMRCPMFLYPTEADYIGSTRVFSALQQNLLKKEKMAIAWFVPRRNAVPTLAAIIPGQEKLGERNEQVRPPGLWVIPLPYVDDVRQNPDTPLVRASDNLTDIMREIIQNLTLPKGEYDPSRYPNPALQWFYRILQAIALEDELPEQPEDKTVPKYRQIDKRVGEQVTTWGLTLEEEFRNWAQSSRKRQPEEESKLAVKKQKTASGAVPAKTPDTIDDDEMKSRYEKGTIAKLTVPILKDWAHSKHISVVGKKGDILERIEDYFEKK